MRQTIDYGIDLGTTNSSVAVCEGTFQEVINNQRGSQLTPSAVYVNKRGEVIVGEEARSRFDADQNNADAFFKRRMGDTKAKKFKLSGKLMLPEELSAEILRSLKRDIQVSRREEIESIVITVPAAFDLQQNEATKKAAELAGFKQIVLLQEPTAAALAYGFQKVEDNEFWMVYDFGGGTFDAVVIKVHDSLFQVVNHAGNNLLGGTDIDNAIVKEVLEPKLREKVNSISAVEGILRDPQTNAKLRRWAEELKIKVSRTNQDVQFFCDDVCVDAEGKIVDLEVLVTPMNLKNILRPYITQTVRLTRKVLEESGLNGADIARVLLVGGSSLFPWIPGTLKDEFGFKCVTSEIDPMTVVARGAAVFAATQRCQESIAEQDIGDNYVIEMPFDPVGPETEPVLQGKVIPPSGKSLNGLRIQISEIRGWRSGLIDLRSNGAFKTQLYAERGRRCEYSVELLDSNGKLLPCTPQKLVYTVGAVATSPPLTHSLGVAKADNTVIPIIKKNTALPATGECVAQTIAPVRKSNSEDAIIIPLVEGDYLRADRNTMVYSIRIEGDHPKVTRDIPTNADVEIDMHIDVSRQLTIKAYIPLLDQEFLEVLSLDSKKLTSENLIDLLNDELSRFDSIKKRVKLANNDAATRSLLAVTDSPLVRLADDAVRAAQQDEINSREAHDRIKALKAALDEIEDAIEWQELVDEARETVERTQLIIEQCGKYYEEEQQLWAIQEDIEREITAEEKGKLKKRIDDARVLGSTIMWRQPEVWVDYFEYLDQNVDHMMDQRIAQRLVAQGRQAINANDLESLKAAVKQLHSLLPVEKQKEGDKRGFGSTII